MTDDRLVRLSMTRAARRHSPLDGLDLRNAAPAEPLEQNVAANAAGGHLRFLGLTYRADDPEGERRAWTAIGAATR